MKNSFFYVKWALTIAAGYVLIKIIDNYQYYFGFVSTFTTILKPFIIGIVIAYLINPIVNFQETKFKFKRWLSILISYSVIIGFTSLFIFIVIPSLANSIGEIIDDIPKYSMDIQMWAVNLIQDWEFLKDPATLTAIKDNILTIIPNVSNLFQSTIEHLLSTTVSLTTLLINLVFAFIISIYFLSDKEKVLSFVKQVNFLTFKEKTANNLVELVHIFNSSVGTYIIAKSLDSFFVGVVSYIGLHFIGSEYALLFGIICGITNMIPYFGPIIGMVPVVLINLLYDPMTAVWALVFLLIVQQIEGNFVEPRFVGGKLGLSPLLTLLAVAIGGGFFGIIGMVLSVPVMGVVKIYIDRIMENKKKQRLNAEDELATE